MTTIWDSIKLGRITLNHRLALSPLTRSRAGADGVPSELAAEYYSQRASLGLLISEGTQPSEDGQGFPNTPGIYTEDHAAGWRKITDAVHAKGAHLFIQLMHAGRMSHPVNTPHGRTPVAPSAIAPGEKMYTHQGLLDTPTPRSLSLAEVQSTIDDFRNAAAKAIAAGAAGVEIHGANGYLVQQFLSPNANVRTDAYGGEIAHRIRFALEVAEAVSGEIGADRTGIRLSPGSRLGGIDEGAESDELYRLLMAELARFDLAYVHLAHNGNDNLLKDIRRVWPNALLVNRVNRPLDTLGSDVAAGLADIVPVGRWGLANPDFVERLKLGAPFNEPDRETFYGSGAKGYTDYPTLKKLNAENAMEATCA
ncbi:alkene reductase [Sinorhizobium meliloti]|uniref:Alkene reductase n=1 Tax=Rhizobium meliloti TaxID=382 RepID=A0A2J0YTE4_RHIML|nr:alkene reductase [Sinorhizobium meliloti]PJR09119.1 alkene reductase [Sinorhizobium meliloti]